MAELDQRHWWYRARREILAALIRRLAPPPPDAQRSSRSAAAPGTICRCSASSGTSTRSSSTTKRARLPEKRLGRSVMSAPLPELAGVPDRHYDLIGAFDVIEHIDDDRAALASIAAKLKPGGKFVMTVPAHQWMWSAHDVVNHHKRRYSKRSLRQLIEGIAAEARPGRLFQQPFVPGRGRRAKAPKLRGNDEAEVGLPPAPLNAALERTFARRASLVGRVPLPPGLSLFAVASAR